MLFNSYSFILCGMPLLILFYFLTNRISFSFGKVILVVTSLVLLSFGDIRSTFVLCVSIAINYVLLKVLSHFPKKEKFVIVSIIVINILLLYIFKYLNFTILIINSFFNTEIKKTNIFLPLGISFFTFQQIMYAVSLFRKQIHNHNFLDYSTYITFFPKLLMGPITEPADFLQQLNDKEKKSLNWNNLAVGLRIFSFGLFKKVVLADTFARAVTWGYSNINVLTSSDVFLIIFFYTLEIYFDFSGYSDMAIGIGKMLNISLPINFDSPYKALSIRDFWKRWHISLTSFFTKYLYFPLGGSRKGKIRTYINIGIVFLVSGLWHGANWTFVLWGILHGLFQITERLFEKKREKLHPVIKWTFTSIIIAILWLLFRSDSVSQWLLLLKKMFTFQNMNVSEGIINTFILPENHFLYRFFELLNIRNSVRGFDMLILSVFSILICLIPDNNFHLMSKKVGVKDMFLCILAFLWGCMCLSNESVFIYLNF